jgi:hypothetical protein
LILQASQQSRTQLLTDSQKTNPQAEHQSDRKTCEPQASTTPQTRLQALRSQGPFAQPREAIATATQPPKILVLVPGKNAQAPLTTATEEQIRTVKNRNGQREMLPSTSQLIDIVNSIK